MTRRRTAHGAAAAGGATVAYEAPATDELRPLPAVVAEPIERRGTGSFTPAGAAAAARRRWELAKRPDFAATELEFIPAPDFAPFDQARRELTLECGEELARSTGGLSRTVWTIVRGACWLTSLAEFWAVTAAKTGDAEASDRASRLFAKASIEKAKALDIATLEAKARPRPPAPWLLADPQSADDDADDDEPQPERENASAPDVGGAAPESEDA